MLVRVRDTGAVMYQQQWEQMYPNTSFPSPLTSQVLNDFGADPVLDGPYPSATIYQVVSSGPVTQIDGQWFTTFIVTDMDQAGIDAVNAQLAANNKTKGKQILSDTDWTAIASIEDPAESNPYLTNRAEFLTYRSAVRNIVLNPTYDAVFPTEPTEQWSS